MRLLVVTQYFWPENFRINDLVSELAKRGHQVIVLTGKPNYPEGKVFPDFAANPKAYNSINNVSIIRVPMLSRGTGSFSLVLNYLSFALSASLMAPILLRGMYFDAIFAYQLSPITVGIPAALIRAIKKAPLVFWVLDLWPETIEALDITRSNLILKPLKMLVRRIYKHCDLILAQSKSFIPKIRQYAGDSAHIEYFPSWSDVSFNGDCEMAALEVPDLPGSFNIMFTGNIGEAQDFPAILKAATILKNHENIRWLIVGSGRDGKWVEEEVQKQGLHDRFILLGRFPVERMPSFIKHADALLVSLKKDPIFSMTIPGKLQSYLAAGRPILAMLDGEGGKIIKDSGAGITCPSGDYVALAESALKLSKMSQEERGSMAEKAIAIGLAEFDRDKLIGNLEAWLKLKRDEFLVQS